MRIGILTGGGDAPGLNAVIRAVVKCAAESDAETIGIEDGFAGLLEPARWRPLTPSQIERQVEGGVHDRLNALLSDADRSAGVTTVVRLGAAPAPAIVEYATEIHADVIVMGTRNGAVLDTLGSVAEQVIRTAPCPVLTLRQPTPGAQIPTVTEPAATDMGRPVIGA